MNDQLIVVGLDERDDEPNDATIDVEADMDMWVVLARSVLHDEGVTDAVELNLTFVDRGEMAELNLEHMGKPGPTDVLSFPLYEDPLGMQRLGDGAGEHLPLDDRREGNGEPRLLGDVVICPEVVAEQSVGGVDDEMALMVVHGVLHILGMDHADPEEAATMRAAEVRHVERWRNER